MKFIERVVNDIYYESKIAFQLIVDGVALNETFGTKSATWHWHDGGLIKVKSKASLALHDLTGFEGRCEAILFCKDINFEPTNDIA